MSSNTSLAKLEKTLRSMMIALAITSLLGLADAKPTQADARTLTAKLEGRALQYVATQQGMAINQLSIATSSQAKLPLSGMVLDEFKLISTDGRIFGISFDAAAGQVVNATAILAQEQKLRQAKYGVLEPGLYNRLQDNAAERIPVAIWIAMEDPRTLAHGKNPNLKALAERVGMAQAPVTEATKELGGIVAQADLTPVIFAELNAGQINALAHHPNVVAIEAIPQDIELGSDDAMTSDRFVFTWPLGTGATGAGAKIAVHEAGGVDDTNPFLIKPVYWCSGVGQGPGGNACTSGKNIGEESGHATIVASVIASTNSWRRGGAWGLTPGSLLSANFGQGDPNSSSPLLFSITSDFVINFVDELNMKQVTDSLRTQFQGQGITLSPTAAIEVIKAGQEWKIVDADHTYLIKHFQKLEVYKYASHIFDLTFDPVLIENLDMKQVTDSLRTQFQGKGITLSPTAAIEVKKAGQVWDIVGTDDTYTIKYIQKLEVYSYAYYITTAQNTVNSAAWAIEQGADTINMSWGVCSDDFLDYANFFNRWADYLVKTFRVNIVAITHNARCGFSVTSPSQAWNTISVGSYFDNNTGGRNDDVLSSFSNWKNPTDPNSGLKYEKPDVVAMGGQSGGVGVDTTGIGGVYVTTSGTSFAAPEVSALTALVISKDANLRRKPETMKAIIMAGATHNIVDGVNYLDCPSSPSPGDCRDGAGAIDAFQTINNIVVPGNWRQFDSISATSFDASGNKDISVNLSQGKDARIVIAWSSTAVCSSLETNNPGCASDVLNADLDLVILDPSKVVVANASSKQNSAEVVDFRPAVTGTYTIQIHKTRFDAGTNTNLGVAWNTDTADKFSNPLVGATDFPINTTMTNQTNDMGQSFRDSYGLTASMYCPVALQETGPEKLYKVIASPTGWIEAFLSNITGFPGVPSNVNLLVLKQDGTFAGCTQTGTHVKTLLLPAGTYYVVVDGANGSVARFDLKVNFIPLFVVPTLIVPTLNPFP